MQQQKELSESTYWDGRYAQLARPTVGAAQIGETHGIEDDHEWFRSFSNLQSFLVAQLLPPTSQCSILHLGCGTSTLPADLYDMGYVHQVSVDFSSVAIDGMRHKYAHLEGLIWKVADVRSMQELDSGSFDVAIDKGTLDSMLYGSPWDPEEDSKENIRKYVDEVARVLSSKGKWLYITFRQPHFLKPLLIRESVWKLDVVSLTGVSGGFEYFGYVMTKISGQDHG